MAIAERTPTHGRRVREEHTVPVHRQVSSRQPVQAVTRSGAQRRRHGTSAACSEAQRGLAAPSRQGHGLACQKHPLMRAGMWDGGAVTPAPAQAQERILSRGSLGFKCCPDQRAQAETRAPPTQSLCHELPAPCAEPCGSPASLRDHGAVLPGLCQQANRRSIPAANTA